MRFTPLPSRPVASPRRAADPGQLSDVYVDESSQTKYRFLALGGIIIPTDRVKAFEDAIWEARGTTLPAGEMAWTKVSRTKLPAYKRVVDVFFDADRTGHSVDFHSLHVDMHLLRDKIFNGGSRDVGFNKEIYQLCIKFARLYGSRLLHVYLDSRNTASTTEKLGSYLIAALGKQGIFETGRIGAFIFENQPIVNAFKSSTYYSERWHSVLMAIDRCRLRRQRNASCPTMS